MKSLVTQQKSLLITVYNNTLNVIHFQLTINVFNQPVYKICNNRANSTVRLCDAPRK